PAAVWHSARHRHYRLLPLDGNAGMSPPQTRQTGQSSSPTTTLTAGSTASHTAPWRSTVNLRLPKQKMHRSYRLFRRNRRGASAVEFALVAPIFVLFVFGMVEYGRMVMVQQVLTNASREGARRAV